MSGLSESEKAVFLAATNRRKSRGIRLKLFAVKAEESQVEALTELYNAWIARFGKEAALDNLIVIWGRAEARLCDRDRAKET